MWGAIVALHGRYPRHLGELKIGWWKDEAHTEILCALAVWRAEIDEMGNDRAKRSSSRQLKIAAHCEQGGGVAKQWVLERE